MSRSATASEGLLLALETSGDVCGVAVTRGGLLLAEHTFRHGMHLSERLIGHMDAVLQEADTPLMEVSALAAGIGPGSFTGTRIGVMTVKTLAAVLEKPVIGISGLEALAAEYAGLTATFVVPLLPCRAGVVYACPYRVEAERPEPLAEAAALSPVELATLLIGLEPRALLFCGPAARRYEAELRSALDPLAINLSVGAVLFPRASQVACLAVGRPADDPLTLVPLYISPPPITVPKDPSVTAAHRTSNAPEAGRRDTSRRARK